MKKYLVSTALFLTLIIGTSCTDNSTNADSNISEVDSGSQSTVETTNGNVQENVIITLGDLKNASSNPSNGFTFYKLKDGTAAIDKYDGDEAIVIIPDEYNGMTVSYLPKLIFANDSPVKAIQFPKYLEEIPEGACALNESLQVVSLGRESIVISSAAFQGCSSLHTVELNDGLKTISNSAFAMCSSLKEITIPASVTEIGFTAFFAHPDDFVIYGEAGSVAEAFAKEAGIEFRTK